MLCDHHFVSTVLIERYYSRYHLYILKSCTLFSVFPQTTYKSKVNQQTIIRNNICFQTLLYYINFTSNTFTRVA